MDEITSPLKRFFRLAAFERKEITAIYFYAIIGGLIALTLPLGIQAIINLLFGGVLSTSIVILIVVVTIGVYINGWIQILQMRMIESIQRRIFTRYSLQFAFKIPRLDLIGVDNYYLPELVNRFFDTALLQKGISKVLLDFPTATVQIIFGIALLSVYNSAFLVLGIVLIFLVGMILRFTYSQGIKTSIEESNYKYEVAYWLVETARTVESLKFMGLVNFPIIRADELVSGYLGARRSHFRILNIQYWSFVVFKVLITLALLTVGCYLVIEQKLNVGQFIASEIVILLVINSVEKIIGSLDVVYDMLTSIEKVSKMLDKPEEVVAGSQAVAAGLMGIAISAQNLCYQYGTDGKTNVIDQLSFDIKAGEKVCILGRQGSGKSTLLKLLTGAYKGYEGQLLYNGYPLRDFDLVKLRQHIGTHLTQDDLFAGSLIENLTMGDISITIDQILRVAEDIGLLSYIQSRPEGLNMPIDSLGKRLPRTIVNKILITRALLRQPQLILLEDCWSSTEQSEQDLLINHLTSLSSTTLIAVTNDEKFARKCDKTMLLDEGKLVAFGTFDNIRQLPVYQSTLHQLSL